MSLLGSRTLYTASAKSQRTPAMDGTAGLFADVAQDTTPTDTSTEKKRNKLYPYDSVASQLFDPWGRSAITRATLPDLWKAAIAGTKKVEYHSHFAADQASDAWHVGAAISQTAQVMLAAIEEFKKGDVHQLIKPDMYKKVLAEMDSLTPALNTLNFGKGSQTLNSAVSMSTLKKRKNETEQPQSSKPPTDEEVQAAAKKMYQWLTSQNSALRAMLMILAGQGTYYSAHAAEKVARACITQKPATAEDFQAAALTRSKSAKPAIDTYDTGKDAQSLVK